jgi:hypothetical protein
MIKEAPTLSSGDVRRFEAATREFSSAVSRLENLLGSIFAIRPANDLIQPIHELTNAIRNHEPPHPQPVPVSQGGKHYMSLSEMANHLGFTQGGFRAVFKRYKVPHLQLKRRLLFDPVAVRSWLAKGTQLRSPRMQSQQTDP